VVSLRRGAGVIALCALGQDPTREAQVLALLYRGGVTAEGRLRPAVLSFPAPAIAAAPARYADLSNRVRALGVRVVEPTFAPNGDTVMVQVTRPVQGAADLLSFIAEQMWRTNGELRKLRLMVTAQCGPARCLKLRELPY
jgi:hypothetical protein